MFKIKCFTFSQTNDTYQHYAIWKMSSALLVKQQDWNGKQASSPAKFLLLLLYH